MSSQQQNSITPANLSRYEQREQRKKEICFQVALMEETGGRYETASQINKVNYKYMRLLESCNSEERILELERRAFENV